MYVQINKDASADESVHAEGMAYFKKMEEGSMAYVILIWCIFKIKTRKLQTLSKPTLNTKTRIN